MPKNHLSGYYLELYEFLLNSTIDEIKSLYHYRLNNEILMINTIPKALVAIIDLLGKIWSEDHDNQGKAVVENPRINSEEFSNLLKKIHALVNLTRPRIPIKISEPKIAVGTLINNHLVSEIIDLQLRDELNILTYYWGVGLTLKDIINLMDKTPIKILVLSLMAVTNSFNGFEELLKIRKEYPELLIIVGGAAFPLFSLMLENPDHILLTDPYKQSQYQNLLTQSEGNLQLFVKKAFNVDYCPKINDLLEIIKSERHKIRTNNHR